MHPRKRLGCILDFSGCISKKAGCIFPRVGCISEKQGAFWESRVHFSLPWFAMALLQQPYTRAKEDQVDTCCDHTATDNHADYTKA
jgi:hypothetical protein